MDNIMKILEELKNTYRCEFIIGDAMFGGMASATRLTEDLYNKIKSRKPFDPEEFMKTTKALNYGSPKIKYMEVIMVNPMLIKMYNIREECIKYIIAHEYGHIKTFHQITERDLTEYRLKVSILQSLSAIDPQLAGNKGAYIYHSLKVEKLANDYAKLPVEKVAQELLNATPDPNWRSLKAMNLVNLQFDQNTFSMLDKLSLINTLDDPSFLVKNKDRIMDSYRYIFGKCIADKKIQDQLMHLISIQTDALATSVVKNESVFQEDDILMDKIQPFDYDSNTSDEFFHEKGAQIPSLWGEVIPPQYLPNDLKKSLYNMRKDYFDTMVSLINSNEKFSSLRNEKYIKLLTFYGNSRPEEDFNGIIFYGTPGKEIKVLIDIISHHFLRYDFYNAQQNIFKDSEGRLDHIIRELYSDTENTIAKKYAGIEPVTGCKIFLGSQNTYESQLTAGTDDQTKVAKLWNLYGRFASDAFGYSDFSELDTTGTSFNSNKNVRKPGVNLISGTGCELERTSKSYILHYTDFGMNDLGERYIDFAIKMHQEFYRFIENVIMFHKKSIRNFDDIVYDKAIQAVDSMINHSPSIDDFHLNALTIIPRNNNSSSRYVIYRAPSSKVILHPNTTFDELTSDQEVLDLLEECIEHEFYLPREVYSTTFAKLEKYDLTFESDRTHPLILVYQFNVADKLIREYIKKNNIVVAGTTFMEDAIDDSKPESDNPIQDTMLDLDRKLSGIQQSVKSKVQGVQRTASAIAKPFKRTSQWITNMVSRWKDANENDIKAKMADPHERSTLLSAFKSAIKYGSLMKAGLLLNPIIMFLTISKKWSDRKNNFRIRNEMIGELKAELEIIEEKIKDADQAQDRSAKYKLMRFRNELKKKLIRVGGTPEMKNMI